MSSELRAPKKYEDFAYVLDYLPNGKIGASKAMYMAEPLVQIIGRDFFTILEAVPKLNVTFGIHEKIYIGKDKPRDKIDHIIGRIEYNTLTSDAKSELPFVLDEIVKENEMRFVDFFNNAQAITPRMNALELIPGIGKKYMWAILKAREKKPFGSFQDLKERTGIPEMAKMVVKRILEELSEEPKYRVFTRSS